jgi:hypothetical protein
MYNGMGNYNQNLFTKGQISSMVQKALTAATGSGEGLIPQHLEQLMTNTMVRLSVAIAMISGKYSPQKYHEFNRITSLPAAGGAMGEGATTPTTQSGYTRTGRNLKVIRRKGAVTNFLQDASKNFIDAVQIEMENHAQAHAWDLETYIMYGNENADSYTHSGLDSFITTNRVNQAVGGAVPGDLSFLDDMIDANTDKQGANHRKAFVMSPQMLSKVSRLLTNVRNNQSAGEGLATIEIAGGWRLQSYRDVPIIAAGNCRPKSTMGTVTASTATAGGTVADATYYFRVAAVLYTGEQLACAQISQAAGGGGTSTVTLAWAAVTGAYYYRIYCSTTTGATKLVAIVPAWAYDANGTPIAAVTGTVFTTSPNSANPTFTLSATGGITSPSITASVNTAMANDVPLVATGGIPPESVFFWDLDEIQGMGKYAYTNSGGSKFNGLVSMEPLAKTDDNLPFMIKTYGALIDSYEATSGLIRGLRVS